MTPLYNILDLPLKLSELVKVEHFANKLSWIAAHTLSRLRLKLLRVAAYTLSCSPHKNLQIKLSRKVAIP